MIALVGSCAAVLAACVWLLNRGHGDRIERAGMTVIGALAGAFFGLTIHTSLAWASDANETCLQTHTQATCTELLR